MTTFKITKPAVNAIAGAARLAARLLAGLQGWMLRRQTRSKLHALDDHLLKDIGLRRHQIDQIGPNSQHEAMRYSG